MNKEIKVIIMQIEIVPDTYWEMKGDYSLFEETLKTGEKYLILKNNELNEKIMLGYDKTFLNIDDMYYFKGYTGNNLKIRFITKEVFDDFENMF